MNGEEQIKLNQISQHLSRLEQLQQDHFQKTMACIDKVEKEVEKINRGMYGDSANHVEGLITRQQKDEDRLTSLEALKKRAVWWGAGFLIGVEIVIQFFRHWV